MTGKLLIVEDEPMVCRIIRDWQKTRHNRECDAVPTLSWAIDRLRHGEKYDCIILDLALPDSHGVKTFSEIHRLAGNLPIVVYTGSGDFGKQLLELGADAVVEKRSILTLDELGTAIDRAIERSMRQVEMESQLKQIKSHLFRLFLIHA